MYDIIQQRHAMHDGFEERVSQSGGENAADSGQLSAEDMDRAEMSAKTGTSVAIAGRRGGFTSAILLLWPR